MNKIPDSCTSCGGALEYKPNIGAVVCEKCDKVYSIKRVIHHARPISMVGSVVDPLNINSRMNYKCSACGASFSGGTNAISGECSYCGCHLIKAFDEANSPDGIIPFAFDKSQAKDMFKKNVQKKKFLPSGFKKYIPNCNIESVYIPSYCFNGQTNTSYDGELRVADEDSDGNTRYRNKHISGTQSCVHNNIFVECSEHITQNMLNEITPYDINGCCKFNKGFILGYAVENPDKKLENARDIAKNAFEVNIRQNILSHYSYSSVNYLNLTTEYLSSNYAYVILPTYKISYKYKNKEYNMFMNGQTGKLGGKTPVSGLKIFATVVGVMALVAGFIGLIFKLT